MPSDENAKENIETCVRERVERSELQGNKTPNCIAIMFILSGAHVSSSAA